MKHFLIFTLLFIHQFILAQKINNDFFVFESIISSDIAFSTFDKKVQLIKDKGFNGIEISELDKFNEKFAAISLHGFKPSFLYVKLDLDSSELDPKLVDAIIKLKGSGTIICPYIIKKDLVLHQPNKSTDKVAVQLLRQLAELANQSGLQVAIYPHLNFYVEKTDHAMRIAKKVDRKNLGLTFNLCHWLATTDDKERNDVKKELKKLAPYLKMMSINGANNVLSKKANIWEDYILPLDEGSFDVKALVKYVSVDLGQSIPIGIQCFGLKGDRELVKRTIVKVNDMKSY
jgi:sugar phosphate isomerase/epimerase